MMKHPVGTPFEQANVNHLREVITELDAARGGILPHPIPVLAYLRFGTEDGEARSELSLNGSRTAST